MNQLVRENDQRDKGDIKKSVTENMAAGVYYLY